MLPREKNELLVRVGPGTEMGKLMRRYWHPVATSRELPEPDCKPLRIELLGERFVLFRNTSGALGMMDEFCIHRGASLALGRTEEDALRCLYHGWKFTIDGTLLETPNHPDPRFRERMRAHAYPVIESNGLIWTYIGAKEQQPPFRKFQADQVPDENRMVFRIKNHVNYLALWEGGLDSSHVSTLHTNQARLTWGAARGVKIEGEDWAPMDDLAPLFEVENTPFGYHYSATRRIPPARGGGDGMKNIRITPAIMPTGRIIGGPVNFLMWETPLNDEWTNTFFIVYADYKLEHNRVYKMLGLDDARYWTLDDQTFKGSWENGFFQDRASMHQNYTGTYGIEVEDAMIGLSYGPIYDRSQEHLVPADVGVMRLRQRLLDNLDIHRNGGTPIALNLEDLTHLYAPDVDVPKDMDWRDVAPEHQLPQAKAA
jgi:phenylpropionate dioxygenase-like ring-hydroxylating dioxygenase large terminal subunit